MRLDIHVTGRVEHVLTIPAFTALERRMDSFDAKLDALEAALTTAVTEVSKDVAGLQTEIDALKAQIADGTVLTPEQVARLDSLTAQVAAINPVPGN